MGSIGVPGPARVAAGLGVAALLLMSCSAPIGGAAVRDSTGALPASTTQAPDWSTAEPPPSTASPSARPTATTHGASTSAVRTRATNTGRPTGDLGLTEMISQVPCDGRVIVLLGSASTPSD